MNLSDALELRRAILNDLDVLRKAGIRSEIDLWVEIATQNGEDFWVQYHEDADEGVIVRDVPDLEQWRHDREQKWRWVLRPTSDPDCRIVAFRMEGAPVVRAVARLSCGTTVVDVLDQRMLDMLEGRRVPCAQCMKERIAILGQLS